MPYGVAGVEIRAALKKASVWNTAVQCGAHDGILILPSAIRRDAPIEVDDSTGTFFTMDGQAGPITVEGDLPCYLRYDGLDVPIALVMGTAGTPVEQGAAPAYAFTYGFAASTDGKFATFAEHMRNYISEVPSLKIWGFTITGEVGKPVRIVFHVTGNDKVFNSTVNTTETFDTVTYQEQQNRVRFSDAVFRMNDRSAGVLASPGDRIYPNSFELSVKRKLRGEHTGEFRCTSGSNVQDMIDEPTSDGMPEIGLTLSFPRHTGTTYLLSLGADTRKKLDITFTGGLIAGTHYRRFALQFPHLQLMHDDPLNVQGIIREPLVFAVHGAVTAPQGMAGITDPIRLSGINTRSTDPLA
jgi:hypothetical protein